MNILTDFLLTLEVVVSLLLVLLVLMQRPKSEGLGAALGGGMMDSLFATQTTNVLQKATRWLGGLFFVFALFLSMLYAKGPDSNNKSGVQQKIANASAPVAPQDDQSGTGMAATPISGTAASGTADSGSATSGTAATQDAIKNLLLQKVNEATAAQKAASGTNAAQSGTGAAPASTGTHPSSSDGSDDFNVPGVQLQTPATGGTDESGSSGLRLQTGTAGRTGF